MSFDDEFRESPVEFLDRYAVVPKGGRFNTKQGSKISTGVFTFRENRHVEPGGRAEKVLDLIRIPPPDGIGQTIGSLFKKKEGFSAYWVAYEDNKSKRAVLGTDAPYMFTARMSGCSFGVGTHTTSGAVLVAHANAKQIGATAEAEGMAIGDARQAQADEQARMLGKKMAGGAPTAIFGPKTYMDMNSGSFGHEATVVGILESGAWQFWAQKRVVTIDAQFILNGLLRFA